MRHNHRGSLNFDDCHFDLLCDLLMAQVAMLNELKDSERTSVKLRMAYHPCLGFGVLAILRGLLSYSSKSESIGKTSAISRKKRA
ncbi:hypothetical protein CQW23_17247 [Capsicum baccatum]|uniref:Uncharacterized protein n=1 Tax=Capsicum baccatum TaxID=33114 RepID=A0A2G2WDD0_CAPBA|nr:hypothetical protein CQW23_17247 [Capsicum baccatum]